MLNTNNWNQLCYEKFNINQIDFLKADKIDLFLDFCGVSAPFPEIT